MTVGGCGDAGQPTTEPAGALSTTEPTDKQSDEQNGKPSGEPSATQAPTATPPPESGGSSTATAAASSPASASTTSPVTVPSATGAGGTLGAAGAPATETPAAGGDTAAGIAGSTGAGGMPEPPSAGSGGGGQGGNAEASGGASGGYSGAATVGGAGPVADDPLCEATAAQYAHDLGEQITCNPQQGDQCRDFINVAPGCSCEVFITPKHLFAIEDLLNTAQDWYDLDCTAECPDDCVEGDVATCQPDPSSALGGTCVTQ